MSEVHDDLTNKTSTAILKKIRARDLGWKQIFSESIARIGDFGWPRPDYVCRDYELKQSIAFEFKPPGQSKREYLTGLGQSVAYLQKHHYAGLIIPRMAEGFRIAEYMKELLNISTLKDLPIALIDYDENLVATDPENAISLLKPIVSQRVAVLSAAAQSMTYWGWWRDTSHYEVLQLLELSDKYKNETGDIYSRFVWPEFWRLMIEGKTKQWDGTPRSLSGDADAPDSSQKQNNKIPLFQLGLWDQADGRLTLEGYKAMSYGRLWGPNSARFLDYLTQLILLKGYHLQLIQDVREFQETVATDDQKSSSAKFKIGVEEYLEKKGAIGPRRPGRTTTDAKGSYLRDEPKLWNKLSLLKTDGATYFFVGEGYKFDWGRITDILTKEFIF